MSQKQSVPVNIGASSLKPGECEACIGILMVNMVCHVTERKKLETFLSMIDHSIEVEHRRRNVEGSP